MESKRSVEILDKQKADVIQKQNEERAKAQVIADQLKGITLEFTANVGADEKMFGTISGKQIEEELKAKHNINIDKRRILTKDLVDHLGYSKIEIELYRGVIGVINVHVSGKK